MGDSSANEASLTILGGPKAGQRFIVEESVDNIVIGSDPSCRFQIDLPGVSPVHARIWIDPQGVTVYETNSPRGLYVNDDRVVAQAPLRNGDVLWLGTPGDEDVVMIQCRFPQARGEMPRAAPAPQSLAEAAMGDTLAFGAQSATAEPEEIEPEEAAIETDVADVADVEPDEAYIEADEVEPTIEADVAAPTPPTEVFMVEDDIPVVTAEPAKFDMDFSKPDLPPNFEEEIQDIAVADQPEPEPPPPPPIAPPDPPPVIAAPPPPPPPRAVSAPPPPAPAPRRAAARPAPAPTPAAAAPAERATGGGLPPAVKWGGLAAGLVVLAVGGYAVVRMMGGSEPAKPQPPPPRPATSLAPASPAVVAEASPEPTPEPETPPPVQEEVTIVQPPPVTVAATPAPIPTPSQRPAATPAPSQRPSPTPRPSQKAAATPAPTPVPAADTQGLQLAAQVPGLLAQAEAAAGARNFDAAIGHYDEVLRLDPQHGRAVEGKAAAQAGAAALKRTFAAGHTSMSGKAAKAEGLGGFATDGVTLAKVPDYSGRVEFEVSPAHVLPGDRYTVRIFLMNDGKKAFKVGSVAVNTTTNGTRAGGSVPLRAREVEPKDRIVLDERTAEWPAGVQSWTLEAVVQTDRDATFTNRLNWR